MGSHEPTMQSAALVLALALGLVSGDGLGHAHGRSHSARRSGRQEAPAVGYEQPPAEYGASGDQAGYDADAAASDADAALAMLQGSIPGVPGRTTPSTPRSQSQDLLVTVRLMEVTTRTPRLSARRSTSARPMALVGSPSTASSAPTEPSSTRTTSSATGGSTLTAPLLRSSTPSTTRSLQRGTPLLALVPMLLETMLLLLLSTAPRDLGLLPMKLLPGEDVSRVAEGGVKHLKAPNVPSPVLVN